MTEEEAKLLFIRKSAQEAYEKGDIEESTKGIFKEIVKEVFVGSMTKEEIGMHISRLEKARTFLAAFTQGLQIGYAKEAEPLFKAKREKERRERLDSKLTTKDKKVNDLIALARDLAEKKVEEKVNTNTSSVKKEICPNCKEETFSLEYHNCKKD